MSSALQKAIASVALSSAVALFVSLHALGDDFGWWRVRTTGAAATAYRNLGVRQEMKPIATREMPNLPVPGTTVLYHGGRLDNGAVQSRTFSTTTDYSYANEHARMRGGQVFRFNVPNRFINENALRKLDSIRGSPLSGEEYRFIGSNVNELNRYLQK